MESIQPTKKPRSEAQLKAFQRMTEAREAAILEKHKKKQEEETARRLAEQPPAAAQADSGSEEDTDTEDQGPQEAAPPGPVPDAPVLQPPAEQEPTGMEVEDTAEDDDMVTFDPDDVYGKLEAAMGEIADLRRTVSGLVGEQGELRNSFVRHHVKAANALSFV